MSYHNIDSRSFNGILSFIKKAVNEGTIKSYLNNSAGYKFPIENNEYTAVVKEDSNYNRYVAIHIGSKPDGSISKPTKDFVVGYNVDLWPTCCGMAILHSLKLKDSIKPKSLVGRELCNLLGQALLEEERIHSSCHKLIFSFSEEELPYQYELAKQMGFSEYSEPWKSYKTSNIIHSMVLDVATEDQLQRMENRLEERSEW